MIKYFVLDYYTWENRWYYDFKVKNAFPDLEPNRPYRCTSLVEGKVKNNLLRVIVNETTEESVYIPESYMTPLEKYRENQIKQLLE